MPVAVMDGVKDGDPESVTDTLPERDGVTVKLAVRDGDTETSGEAESVTDSVAVAVSVAVTLRVSVGVTE